MLSFVPLLQNYIKIEKYFHLCSISWCWLSQPEKIVFGNLLLARLNNRKLDIKFNGGNISSDGGLLPIHLLDKKLKITSLISKELEPFDSSSKGKITHKTVDLLKQRIYGIISGNEDLNDHNDLRKADILKIILGKETNLAGSSTLCRFENDVSRDTCVALV